MPAVNGVIIATNGTFQRHWAKLCCPVAYKPVWSLHDGHSHKHPWLNGLLLPVNAATHTALSHDHIIGPANILLGVIKSGRRRIASHIRTVVIIFRVAVAGGQIGRIETTIEAESTIPVWLYSGEYQHRYRVEHRSGYRHRQYGYQSHNPEQRH